MGNKFLLAAYVLVAAILVLYAGSLFRRQARAKKELEELSSRLRDHPPKG